MWVFRFGRLRPAPRCFVCGADGGPVMDGDVIQVVMTPVVQRNFQSWLDQLGLRLFLISHADDDLATYGVAAKDDDDG